MESSSESEYEQEEVYVYDQNNEIMDLDVNKKKL